MAEFALRIAGPEDEDFLWLMLFYASHSNDEEGVTPLDIRGDSFLRRYVVDWGRDGDIGVLAESEKPVLGAAWVRVLTGEKADDVSSVDDETPELAIAVMPGFEGRGIGTAMLEELIELSRHLYAGMALSVRNENPAVRLYERLGFQAVDHIVNRVGTESVKMVLSFSSE